MRIHQDKNCSILRSLLAMAVAGSLTVACQSPPTSTPDSSPTIETGRLSVDASWQVVDFKESFVDPVVVAKPASGNGVDPTTIRLRAVSAGSFEIRLEEWAYLNGKHGAESISYLAVERGRRALPGGGAVEAGSLELSNPGTNAFVPVSFSEPFATVPVVLSIVGTDGEGTAVVTRHQNVDTQGFEILLQEEEAQGEHGPETAYWIAWQPGVNAEAASVAFEAGIQDGVTHEFTGISFASTFSKPPCFVADMQTFNGPDPANLRYRDLTVSQVEVRVEDEKSADEETRHGAEKVGWVALACD